MRDLRHSFQTQNGMLESFFGRLQLPKEKENQSKNFMGDGSLLLLT